MANTLGGINLAQIAQQTLETLSAEMPVVSAFTTDFSSDVADVGESVSTRVATAVSAGDATSGYSSSDVTSTAKTITLNKHKHFTAKFTDLEVAKGGLDMLERTFVRPAVHAVVNAMMDDLLALVVNATYSNNTVVTAANFGADDVATLAGDLTTLNVQRSPRSMVIKPAYYAALAKDNAIQASYAFGNPGAIQDNNIPRVHGFDVLEYSDVRMDLARHRVIRNDQAIHLGPTEFRLLRVLMQRPGRVFSREQLLDRAWGRDVYVESRTVDVHIRRLRKALNIKGLKDIIRTVRGAGYAIDEED